MTLGTAVFGEGPRPLDSLEALTLSPGSLTSASGQPSVWIVDPATSAVSSRPITIARYETDRVVVAAGLRPGDLVVTRNAQKMSQARSRIARIPDMKLPYLSLVAW